MDLPDLSRQVGQLDGRVSSLEGDRRRLHEKVDELEEKVARREGQLAEKKEKKKKTEEGSTWAWCVQNPKLALFLLLVATGLTGTVLGLWTMEEFRVWAMGWFVAEGAK